MMGVDIYSILYCPFLQITNATPIQTSGYQTVSVGDTAVSLHTLGGGVFYSNLKVPSLYQIFILEVGGILGNSKLKVLTTFSFSGVGGVLWTNSNRKFQPL